MTMIETPQCLTDLKHGRATVWARPSTSGREALSSVISPLEVTIAAERMAKFAPLLKALFSSGGWDGCVTSKLIALPEDWLLVKADHDLPMTGSIKARGGVHEVLCYAEQVAHEHVLIEGGSYASLMSERARNIFLQHTVAVASTGNLGYSVGLVARALGLAAEIHMSRDAKRWKKDRLRAIGATVIEHDCDYSDTVSRARSAVGIRPRSHFVDDENSRHLFTGYAAAGAELASQLVEKNIPVNADHPLVVYLPCGVGGAPGGITYGLKEIFGSDVISVFVEPVASACMMVAMAAPGDRMPSCYEFGGTNQTIADGLAVPKASELVVSAVGNAIDAVVAVTDADMLESLRWAWKNHGLRLEPAAAAAFAGRTYCRKANGNVLKLPATATEIVWTTGGSQLPDNEFFGLVGE